MEFSLQEKGQNRSDLLQHELLSQVPRQALEKLLEKGLFLGLNDSNFNEFVTPESCEENILFLLQGRLGIYQNETHFCLSLIKENEDFVSSTFLENASLVALTPQIKIFQISLSEWNSILHNDYQTKKSLSLTSLSLGAYRFFKRFKISNFNFPMPLLNAFELEFLNSGECVVREGEASDKFYFISHGTAKVIMSYEAPGEEFVRTLEEDDYFGEMGLLTSSVRQASVFATNQMALFSLSQTFFEQLMLTSEGQVIREYFTEQTQLYSFKESNIIGSASGCNPRLLDYRIAPHHIKIGKIKERSGHFKYSVKPACDTQKYHTFVNKQPIYQEVILNRYDELVIGNYKVVIDPIKDQISLRKSSFHTLQLCDLSYVQSGHTIVDNISLTLQSNQLVGVLGPSGSGKSTLLELIYGIKKPTSGNVFYDRTSFHSSAAQSDFLGLVPQDDILYSHLTVYENLFFDAKIRRPHESSEKINQRIEQVLSVLKLEDKKDAVIGSVERKGLSGGQKKRVNIARELLFEPDILLLDEPVSGLSSRDAEEVISVLRTLSDMGKMVIIVMHQPSSTIYKMFDQTLLLDEGGKLVYFGPAHTCLSYMNTHGEDLDFLLECPQCLHVQPDKIFSILEKRDHNEKRMYSPEFWQESFQKLKVRPPDLSPPQDQMPLINTGSLSLEPIYQNKFGFLSHFSQFYHLIKRTLILKLRDKSSLWVQFLTPLVLALLIAFILRSNPSHSENYVMATNGLIPTYLFISIIISIFLGATGSSKDIVGEQALYKREATANLKNSGYILSKFVVQSGFAGLQLMIYIFIGNTILGISGYFWHYFYFLYLSSLFGVSLGLMLSSYLKSTEAVINFIPLVLIPQIILGGGLIPFEDMNTHFFMDRDRPFIPEISHFIPVRWAYEGVIVLGANPRETAISELQIIRDEVFVKQLTESPTDHYKLRLEAQVMKLDEASGRLDSLYSMDEYPQSNEPLGVLVAKGLTQYYKTELDRGVSFEYQINSEEIFPHFFFLSEARHPSLNWAFYAPKKSFRWGRFNLEFKTIWFNGLMLILMIIGNLFMGLVLLNRKKRTMH